MGKPAGSARLVAVAVITVVPGRRALIVEWAAPSWSWPVSPAAATCGVGAGQRPPLVVDAAEQGDGDLGAGVYADRCRGGLSGCQVRGEGAARAVAARRRAGRSARRGLSCRCGGATPGRVRVDPDGAVLLPP